MKINKEKENALTHGELTKILSYNKDTGIFIWNEKICRNVVVSKIAGCRNKKHGYIEISIRGNSYKAHRLAWFYVHGIWPENLIDHKDNIRHHNWISNLRESNHSLNAQNHKKPNITNRSTSNIPGVKYRAERKKWRVSLTINKKETYFGHYNTQLEAESVCLEMRRKYYEGNLL